MNAKRLLFLTHRWLGIGLFILILLWIVSGIVMMYVGYPKLTPEERAAHALPLGNADCCLGAMRALEQLAAGGDDVIGLRLFDHGQPTLVALLANRSVRAFDGVTGEALPMVNPAVARRNAARFFHGAALPGVESVVEDAWTHTKSLDPYRPFYRVNATEGDIAQVYVSALTGEVMRDVSHTEKWGNWAGAWIHWLYMFRGGSWDSWWSDILIVLSFGALLLACTGLITGILRWRRHGYKNGSGSPYVDVFQRIHHVLGLVFGFFLITWLFSGFFSMNPAKIFDSRSGAKLSQAMQADDLLQAPAAASALACMRGVGFEPVELEWLKTPSGIHVLGTDRAGQSMIHREGGSLQGAECVIRRDYGEDELLVIARQALPAFEATYFRQQGDYDWHYYPRAAHTMHGHHLRPLPVFAVAFNDPESTTLYIDYRTGRIVHRTDSRQKSMRALFKFLHSFDWYPLLASRPAWDIFLLLASLGGLVIGVTGSVLAFRRLRRTRL